MEWKSLGVLIKVDQFTDTTWTFYPDFQLWVPGFPAHCWKAGKSLLNSMIFYTFYPYLQDCIQSHHQWIDQAQNPTFESGDIHSNYKSLAAAYTYYRSLSQEQSLKDRGLHEQWKIEHRHRQHIQWVSFLKFIPCVKMYIHWGCLVIKCVYQPLIFFTEATNLAVDIYYRYLQVGCGQAMQRAGVLVYSCRTVYCITQL